MKYKYDLVELNAVGVDNVRSLVERAHAKYNCDKAVKDEDTEKAYLLYRYIMDNNCTQLKSVLDYVFQNNLWSAWRRGQSTFKDLIRENAETLRRELEREARRKGVTQYDENFPSF